MLQAVDVVTIHIYMTCTIALLSSVHMDTGMSTLILSSNGVIMFQVQVNYSESCHRMTKLVLSGIVCSHLNKVFASFALRLPSPAR